MMLERGDFFEVEQQEWLRSRLPTYEMVWQDFIGNDGLCHPLPIQGLDSDQEIRRRSFCQAHYTFALRCFSIDASVKRADGTLGIVKDAEGLRYEFSCLNYFMCDIGQVRDMFGKMDSALRLGGKVVEKLQEFYDLRSHILHGPQMPFFLDDSRLLKIPLVVTRNKSKNEWDDETHWGDVDPSTFVFAADFCRETGEKLFETINTLHPKIYDAAHRLFGGRKVNWSQAAGNKFSATDMQSNSVNSPIVLASGDVGIKHNYRIY